MAISTSKILNLAPRVNLNVVNCRFSRRRPPLKSWPNDWVPFHWSRPVKIHGALDTGDLEATQRPRKDEVKHEYRQSEELKKLKLDDPIRKLLSEDHAALYRQTSNKAQRQIENLGLIHDVDYPNSLEAKIITLTHRVRYFQDAFNSKELDDRYTGHLRTIAANSHQRRYRYLTDLKELHQERYQRVIKDLNIEPKENKINVKYERPYRKKQMRRLAIEYSRDLREKKVEEFLKSLEKEKKEFELEKEETLRWISEKEKELGYSVS